MEGKSSEADQIRKQIQFLTSLIETANQESTSSDKDSGGRPDVSHRPYERKQFHGMQSGPKHKPTLPTTHHTSLTKSCPSYKNKNVTDQSKYSWKKSPSDSKLIHNEVGATGHKGMSLEQETMKKKQVLSLNAINVSNKSKPAKIPSSQPIRISPTVNKVDNSKQAQRKVALPEERKSTSVHRHMQNPSMCVHSKPVCVTTNLSDTDNASVVKPAVVHACDKIEKNQNRISRKTNEPKTSHASSAGQTVSNESLSLSSSSLPHKQKTVDSQIISSHSVTATTIKSSCSRAESKDIPLAETINSSCSMDESNNLSQAKTTKSSCSMEESKNLIQAKSVKSSCSMVESKNLIPSKTAKSSCSLDKSKNLIPAKSVKSSCSMEESKNLIQAKTTKSSCSMDESKNLIPAKTVKSSCSMGESKNLIQAKTAKSSCSMGESKNLIQAKTAKSSCSMDESKNLIQAKSVKSSCSMDESKNSSLAKTTKYNCSRDEGKKLSPAKTSLLEHLKRAQSKISTLRKAMSDGSIKDSMSPTRTPLRAAIKKSVVKEKGGLLSLSPYKMKRIDSESASMTAGKAGNASAVADLKGHFSNGVLTDAKKDTVQTGAPLRTAEAKNSDNILKSKYSYRKPNSSTEMPSSPVGCASTSTSDLSTSTCTGSLLTKSKSGTSQIPSKLVHKSKYSLKRVRTHSSGRNERRVVSPQSSNEAKSPTFISLSKFSLKRVRRSLSDGDKKSRSRKQSLTVDRRFNTPLKAPSSSHSQHAAKIIMSKYKMKKVIIDDGKSLTGSTIKRMGTGYSSSFGTSYSKYSNNSMSWPYRGKGHLGSNYWKGERLNHYQGGMFARPSKYYPYGMTRHMAAGGFRRLQMQFGFSGRSMRRGQFGYRARLQRVDWNHRFSAHNKFIRRKVRKVDQLKEEVPFNPRMKLDRRMGDQDPGTYTSIKNTMYKYNKKYISGVQPMRGLYNKQQQKANKLSKPGEITAGHVSRINLGGVAYMQTRPGTIERLGSVVARMAAARAVSRSVAQAVMNLQKASRKSSTGQRQYCLFFNRFGKCNRGNSCPFIHDRNRIAVCTRFLRGTCKVKDCPFSHTVSKEKMPVCSFFLRGMCTKDDCPYLHVNVNRHAEICLEFVNGYCPLGEKCKRKHTLLCPSFAKTGYCAEGKKCKLQHRKTGKKKSEAQSDVPADSMRTLSTSSSQAATVTASTSDRTPNTADMTPSTSDACTDDRSGVDPNTHGVSETSSAIEDDSHLPFKERRLPAYISLNMKQERADDGNQLSLDDTSCKNSQESTMKIRPHL